MLLLFIYLFFTLFLIKMIIDHFYIKENFKIEKDERCKKKGEIFSDFPIGTICIGPGEIKTF